MKERAERLKKVLSDDKGQMEEGCGCCCLVTGVAITLATGALATATYRAVKNRDEIASNFKNIKSKLSS